MCLIKHLCSRSGFATVAAFVLLGNIMAFGYSDSLWIRSGSSPNYNIYYRYTGGNVAIGTSSISEKLNVAGNIQVGDPAASTAAYYEINMPGGASTINSGNGRELYIKAGSSDNSAGQRGGHLYLRPGIPSSPATTYGNVIIADQGGNCGLGTDAPTALFHMVSEGSSGSPGSYPTANRLEVSSWAADGPTTDNGIALLAVNAGRISTNDTYAANAYLVRVANDNGPVFVVKGNGAVGIGTTTTGTCKLAVEGKIVAREVIVTQAGSWPDFVFQKDYKLKSLDEVEKHYTENKHLENIPTAAEVQSKGIPVGEMQVKLLQKMEEMTLYMVALNKENKDLKNQVEELRNEIGK